MGKTTFDYRNTCPLIDKQINLAEDAIYDFLKASLKETFNLDDDKSHEIASDWSGELYKTLSPCFEVVRESNTDMRNHAESQIADLADTITTLEEELKDLQYWHDKLEDKLSNYT